MAKRTDLALTSNGTTEAHSFVPTNTDDKPGVKSDDISALKGNIEQTRGEMSRTVNEIEQRLSPANIKEQIADVKDSLVAQYHDAKQHIKEDIVSEVREAKDKVKEEIGDAKQMVQDQLVHAKDVVVDATVGRVKEMAADVKDMAVDAGHAVKDAAVDAGNTVKDLAVDAGQTVKHIAADAGHAVGSAGSSVLATVRRNPIPVALLAVGAGWLAVNMLRGGAKPRVNERRYGGGYDQRGIRASTEPSNDVLHRVGDKASALGQRVSDTASKLGHSVGERATDVRDRAVDAVHDATARVGALGHRVSDGASNMAHSAGEVAHEVRDRAVDLVHDAGDTLYRAEETLEETYAANPLPFGAVALAVGAAVGLALPHTAREDAWLGDAKDRLLQSAGEMAQTAIHSVQEQAAHLTGQDSA